MNPWYWDDEFEDEIEEFTELLMRDVPRVGQRILVVQSNDPQYTAPYHIRPLIGHEGRVTEIIEREDESSPIKVRVTMDSGYSSLIPLPFIKMLDDKTSFSGKCIHEFVFVGAAPFSNSPWFDCKKCGKRKEDCE